MSGVLDDLNRAVARDMERARRRQAALELLAYAEAQLRRHGFAPLLVVDAFGLVTLSLDFDRVGTAAPAVPAAAAEPEPKPAPKVAPEPPPAPKPAGKPEPAVRPEAEAVSAPAPEPKPAPGPEPQPEPAPDLKTGPIEGEDRARALDLLAKGMGPADVARRLNRKVKQIENFCYRNQDAIKARAGGQATAQAPAPKPGPVPKAAPAPADDRAGAYDRSLLSASERAIDAHLDAVGGVSPWNSQKDLDLAESLVRGDGAAGAAFRLGIEKQAVIDRWAMLNTERGSIDHQTRLLRVLRLRAGAIRKLAAE